MAVGSAVSGKNMFLGLAMQSGIGVVGTVFDYYQPTDVSGVMEEYEFKKSDKRVGTRFAALGRKGAKKIPFSFTVEANPGSVGRLLAVMTGAEAVVVTVVAEVGTHTFTMAEALPYFTLVVYSGGVADSSGSDKAHQLLDCKVNTWSLKGGVDGDVVKITIEGEALSRSAIAKPTPSYGDGTITPFILHSAGSYGTIKIGANVGAAAQFDEATEFSLQADNGLAADRRINGTGTPVAIREGDSSVKGSMKVIFNDNTFDELDAYQAGTERALVATMTIDAAFYLTNKYSLKIEMDRTLYTGGKPTFDADVISAELPFDVMNTTNFKIILVNDKVVAYSAAA